MDIEKCRINMKVRTKRGYEGKIIGIWPEQVRIERIDGIHYATAGCIEPTEPAFKVGDRVRQVGPSECGHESCEMARVITNQCKQIADLQKNLEQEKQRIANIAADAATARRNAAYWREELTKLQKEALECDMVPLAEVGKFYLTCKVDASQFLEGIEKVKRSLLSQEARRVVELLVAVGPSDFREIVSTIQEEHAATIDGIIEARDAGIIELVDGKYQVVK